MLSWAVNSRHTLRLTSPGTCVPFDPQLSTLNFSPCNSFTSFSLRTLASHFQTPCPSIPFAFNHFRTLCQIPGIGYPPPSIFFDSFLIRSPQPSTRALRSASARIAHFFAITPFLVTLALFMGGRGGIPNSSQESSAKMKLESASPSRLPRTSRGVRSGRANRRLFHPPVLSSPPLHQNRRPSLPIRRSA
jgi:hypothetical protein